MPAIKSASTSATYREKVRSFFGMPEEWTDRKINLYLAELSNAPHSYRPPDTLDLDMVGGALKQARAAVAASQVDGLAARLKAAGY